MKLDRITVDPAICMGQPTIRGTRITVGVILKMLAQGKNVEDVLRAYPELDEEDVRQAILYAAKAVSKHMTNGRKGLLARKIAKRDVVLRQFLAFVGAGRGLRPTKGSGCGRGEEP